MGNNPASRLVDPKERYRRFLRVKLEEKNLGRKAHHISHGHRLNTAQMAESESPSEVTHLLLDYRNGNTVVARKTMNRRQAYEFNQRLKGTGFAWAVRTGY